MLEVRRMGWWLGVLAGLAACGDGDGSSFTVDCEECDDISDQIEAEVANPSTPAGELQAGQEPCGPFDDPSLDVPHYANACEALRECLGEVDACSDS